jgi:hypothetical protein
MYVKSAMQSATPKDYWLLLEMAHAKRDLCIMLVRKQVSHQLALCFSMVSIISIRIILKVLFQKLVIYSFVTQNGFYAFNGRTTQLRGP